MTCNYLFGETIDKTKKDIDQLFKRSPSMQQNKNENVLDKASFLNKFSCFQGYIDFIKKATSKNSNQQYYGFDINAFKKALTQLKQENDR